MGIVLLPFFFTGLSNIAGVLNKTFLLVSSAFLFVCLFCCFSISLLSSGGEKEDYVKCERTVERLPDI